MSCENHPSNKKQQKTGHFLRIVSCSRKGSLLRECGDTFHLALLRSKTPATARISFITKSILFKTILDAIDMHG